ncbi:hypothetical protein [Parasitella parasitica]|uniref:GST N-terminal domain-containing protein n=1 Tax=Parasitella parasitica TaxID=35722 RepID=A0A0B7NLZ4_9FUNG|nr:hypothetical protein [Parasitella parasitica]
MTTTQFTISTAVDVASEVNAILNDTIANLAGGGDSSKVAATTDGLMHIFTALSTAANLSLFFFKYLIGFIVTIAMYLLSPMLWLFSACWHQFVTKPLDLFLYVLHVLYPVIMFCTAAVCCGLFIGGCAGFAAEAFSSILINATWGPQAVKGVEREESLGLAEGRIKENGGSSNGSYIEQEDQEYTKDYDKSASFFGSARTILKWVLIATVCGIVTFFTIFGIDFNSRITPRDFLASARPESGPLSSTCFKSSDTPHNQHFGIIPSVPVKEDDVCFDYAGLIKPQHSNATTPIVYHTYWSTHMTKYLTENQLASLRSFAATQPSHHTLFFWITSRDKPDLLKPDSLWLSVKSPNVQLKILEEESNELLKDTPLATLEERHLQELLRLASLYLYGGVWFDLDVLFVRDLSPLLHLEWLTQSTCFELSQFASASAVDSRFSGALMHFFPQSPYVCEMLSAASDELNGVVNGLKPLRSLGPDLYARVFHRMLRHRITPWAVLPWCFTDPSQCHSSNALPSAFDNVREFSVDHVNKIFAYHWHEQWKTSPGTIFKHLVEQQRRFTTCKNILYYNPGSVFSSVGVLLLCQKNVQDQFELRPIQMGVDNISPWYIKLNPKGQVPTLVHQGQPVPDTLAIASYLDEQFKPSIFATDDAQVVALIEQWRQVRVLSLLSGKKTALQDVSQMAATLESSRQQVEDYARSNPELAEAYNIRLNVHDDRSKILTDHGVYLMHKERLTQLLDNTEKALLDNGGKLLPRGRTAADAYAVGILHWLKSKLDSDILKSRPMTAKYYEEQASSPSFIHAFKK